MKNQIEVVNLELSKKLKELGVKQESLKKNENIHQRNTNQIFL